MPSHCWGCCITHNQTHTHPVGLPWTSDQPVAEVATHSKHNKHNRRTYTRPAGFETAIPAIKGLHTYALGPTTMGIGNSLLYIISVYLSTTQIVIFSVASLFRFRDHTHAQNTQTRLDSSGRVISLTQRPLPDNTNTHKRQISVPSGIRTRKPR
jgi:hypothetical protein